MWDLKVKRNIEVTLQMSRASDGNFYLAVEDKASGLRIVEVVLDDAALADFMSTQTTKALKAEYYHNEVIGKTLEVKPVKITVENSQWASEHIEQIFLLAEEDHPGWVCDREKFNRYRWNNQDQTYAVTLRRFV